MHIGLTYDETYNMPMCELLTLIAIEQIKAESMEYKPTDQEEKEEFLGMLGYSEVR